MAIALKKQPQIGIARANLLSAQGRTGQTASALNPQFVGNAGLNDQRDIKNSTGAVGNPVTASVTLRQLIYDFGRTRDQVRQQSSIERSFQQALTRTQQTVALQVRVAFYDLIQSIANVATSEANVSNRQRQLDQAQARMDSGLGAPVDVVQAKTNLADAAISLTTSRDTVLTNRVALAQLLGIDSRTPIVPASAKEIKLDNESDLELLVTDALKNRPDIKAAQETVTAARYGVFAANKDPLPTVTANAGVNGRGANDPFPTQTATFGVNVTWTFGDGGLAAGKRKEAHGSEDAARQNLIQISNQAVSEVSQYFVDLQSASQRVNLAQVEVANALELVRISEGRYTGGLGQFLDVTSAQNSLFTANQRLSQAQEDVERTRARLRTAIGLM